MSLEQSRELAAALETLRYAATGITERTELPSRQAEALLQHIAALSRATGSQP